MVKIDKEECISCGACVVVAPKCFEMGKDNKAHIKSGCKCDADCKEAIEACPVDAISL